jgi:hypothetical protein
MRLFGPSSASVSGGEVEPFLPRMTKTRLIGHCGITVWWLAVRVRDSSSHQRAMLTGGEGALWPFPVIGLP